MTLPLYLLAAMLVLAMLLGAVCGWLMRDFIACCDRADEARREAGHYDPL